MDDFRDLMTAQMDDATARFAEEDFAALYGSGIVGRVRRRRTVRAASVGGGTMLTAGALALAATHLPINRAVTPAGSGDCATPWPSGSSAPYALTHRYADYLPNGEEGPWTVVDGFTGEPVFTVTAQDAGETWLVAFPNGETSVVPYSGAGEFTVDVPGGEQFVLGVTVNDGVTEIKILAPASSGECFAPSSPSTASADPTETASTAAEDVTSPFQCGFVMDVQGQESDVLHTTGLEWVEPADYVASQVEIWGSATDLPQDLGTLPIPLVDLVEGSRWETWGGAAGFGDPVDVDVSSGPMRVTGFGFVKVNDGVVVGILDPATQELNVNPWYDGTTITVALLNAEEAFMPCQDQGAGMKEAETYFVAGSKLDDATGLRSEGPYYVWRLLDQQRPVAP
ncbi:hypothetical protein [Demequina sp.]|uniref:hypothetical protein n=1 Tax=Demequina sp. TaxID=2050685 RepID=UPI0025BC66CF|nr:hypothetical protein [Demequina sp.]